jgi:hypothetical protein
MPLFNQFGPLTVQVGPGTTITLFDPVADSLTAPAISKVICPVDAGPVGRHGISFTISFAAAPTAVVELFGSNTPPTTIPQGGVLLYTSTNTQNDNYTDNSSFAYYWAELVSESAGGALSVIAHVR